LWATIDWSYALLPAAEREVFVALAVFAGGWTLKACEWIAADDGIDQSDVPELVTRLVAKSLVVAEPRSGGRVRYKLLDAVRQYAAKQLQQAGRMEALRARYCDWFLTQANLAIRAQHGPTESQEFARLEADLGNLRAALDWMVTGSNATDRAAVVAARLWWFWQTIGHYAEGRGYLKRLLDSSHLALAPATRAEVLHAVGMLAWNQQGDADLEVARKYHEESLSIRSALGDAPGIRSCLGGLARTLAHARQETLTADEPRRKYEFTMGLLRLPLTSSDVSSARWNPSVGARPRPRSDRRTDRRVSRRCHLQTCQLDRFTS
jgi:hypothetical protein